MTDLLANQIVFLILLFVIIGIALTTNMLIGGVFINKISNIVKNNSGAVSGRNIIMLFLAIIFIYFILVWLFKPKVFIRQSRN
jgi:hypothetical protein